MVVSVVAVGAVGISVNAGLDFCACTNAVVASSWLLSFEKAVGAVGIAINAGPDVTNSVVANWVVLVPAEAVRADAIPVNVGLAILALRFSEATVELLRESIAFVVNAAVAICVVLAPATGVGAVGIPVNIGEIFCATT